jgi:hypothetical protein
MISLYMYLVLTSRKSGAIPLLLPPAFITLTDNVTFFSSFHMFTADAAQIIVFFVSVPSCIFRLPDVSEELTHNTISWPLLPVLSTEYNAVSELSLYVPWARARTPYLSRSARKAHIKKNSDTLQAIRPLSPFDFTHETLILAYNDKSKYSTPVCLHVGIWHLS